MHRVSFDGQFQFWFPFFVLPLLQWVLPLFFFCLCFLLRKDNVISNEMKKLNHDRIQGTNQSACKKKGEALCSNEESTTIHGEEAKKKRRILISPQSPTQQLARAQLPDPSSASLLSSHILPTHQHKRQDP
jgi:hypothetical protein